MKVMFNNEPEEISADQTALTNEEEDTELEGIPDEDASLEEEEEVKQKEKKVDRSEVAQKKRWRERAESAQSEVESLKQEIARLKSQGQPTEDEEKELKAKKFIRDAAIEAIEERERIKSEQENKAVQKFQAKLDTALEDYPELTEEQIVSACEEYGIEPDVAAKILDKQSKSGIKKKTGLPNAKKGSPEISSKPDDSKKSIWEIAQDIKKNFKK